MPVLERRWWTLIAICIAVFMLLLDITVVNVALPDIQRSLHSSFSDLQWVVDAYALTLAAFLLTAGVVGDMFGRREVFAIGLAVFSISSLVCGLSTSSLMLNLARGAQGVGGAIMFATSLALVAAAFSGKERGTAFGIFGAVNGAAVAIGPLVGGAITSSIGWRWIFFLNVPIGAVAILITLTKVRESRDPNTRRIDWLGFVTFTASLFMLVYALVRGNDAGWGSAEIVGLLVGAAVLLAVFLIGEWRQRDPMLDLSLFRRPAMIGASAVAFTLSASIFSLFLYLTLYIQDDLGYGPFAAGLRFLPLTLLSFAVAPVAGRLTVRIHSRFLLGTGMALVAIGLFLIATTSPTSSWLQLLPGFILTGAGIGMVNPVLASTAISVVPPERSGMASGTNSTFRQVGIATGIAALGAIFQSQIVHRVTEALQATPAGRAAAAQHGQSLGVALTSGEVRAAVGALPAAQQHAVIDAYRVGFSGSMNELSIIAGVIAVIGSIAGFVLVRQRDFVVSYGAPPRDRAPPTGRRRPRASGESGTPGGAASPAGAPSPVPVTTTEAPTRPAPRSPGRPRDARVTSAILASTIDQLHEVGYAGLSIEGVASTAGVSRATVYRRFRDKADLATAAIAEDIGPIPTPGSGSPRAELVEQLGAFERRFGDQCVAVLGALASDRDEPHALALHRARTVQPRTEYFTDVLRRAQSAGELDPGADVELATELLVGAVFARTILGRDADPGWAERAVAMVWEALVRSRPGTGRLSAPRYEAPSSSSRRTPRPSRSDWAALGSSGVRSRTSGSCMSPTPGRASSHGAGGGMTRRVSWSAIGS